MPHKTLEFDITPDCAGARLDRCLSRLIPGSSRAYLQKLIKDGLVQNSTGSSLTLPRYPVKAGEHILVTMPEIEDTSVKAEDFDYPILFEDEHMLVIAKPAGVVVHPAAGNPDGTIVNALLGRYPGFGERFQNVNGRPGIVHRLDKDTSGCLVVAKTPDALFKLGTAFAEHTTQKTYLALVRGVPKKRSDEIVNLIGRHPVNRQKMAVVERNGKMAISLYRTKKSGTLDGNPVSLSDFLGTPVVLNFWASWCGPCKNEMPDFNTAWSEYGDRVQFMMVNLTDNFQETTESAKAFLDTVDYQFPVFFDTKMEGGVAYGVTGIPATYFINAEGQVVARAVSMLDYETLIGGIQMLLEE